MIRGRRTFYELTCDECGSEDTVHHDDWGLMIQELRNIGWKNFKDDSGKWRQECPECYLDKCYNAG